MEILIKNSQKKIRLNPLRIKRIIEKILRAEGISKASLSFVFVSHQKIRALNKQFLKKDFATDVLAFDASDGSSKKKPTALLGDIIISTDAAIKNAELFNSTQQKEVVLYVIHGILHLLGYDDHRSCDVKRMREKEGQLLALVGSLK